MNCNGAGLKIGFKQPFFLGRVLINALSVLIVLVRLGE
jgi:hypothetical protein